MYRFGSLLEFPVFCTCYNEVKPSIQDTDLYLLLLFVLLPWFQSIWGLCCYLCWYYSELLVFQCPILFHYIDHVTFGDFFIIWNKYVSFLFVHIYQILTWMNHMRGSFFHYLHNFYYFLLPLLSSVKWIRLGHLCKGKR